MASRITKYRTIVDILEERIRRGDYVLRGLQSDRSIAEEFGVSRLTANKALRTLVKAGIIQRKTNGRLVLPGAGGAPSETKQIAFLAPSFPSPFLQRLRAASAQVAQSLGCRFRPIDYLQWTDQVVHETLRSFDGVILCQPGGTMPDSVLQRLLSCQAGLLSLNVDMSGHAIPSLQVDPHEDIQMLCDHLAGLGHREIDCLHVHSPSPDLEMRMQQWSLWRAAHGLGGELLRHDLKDYADSLHEGYRFARAELAQGRLRGTAIVCTTELATLGACRALAEAGRHPGRDVSICTYGGDGFCRFANPAVTCLELPDLTPHLKLWFAWILRGHTGWIGPLLMRPHDSLFLGETTAPPGGWPDGARRVLALPQ